MQKTIYVLEGSYRNKLIENQTFQLVKPYQPHPHKEGGYITVKVNPEDYAGATSDKIKVHVANENQLRDSAPEQPKEESDAETVERMRKRFTILDSMTKACKKGDVRAMIVSGPPGVGKSYGVETVLDRYGVVSTLGNTAPKYEVVKGAMSPIGLYCKLYNYSGADNVLVFDDCDSILLDDLSLNILKQIVNDGMLKSYALPKDTEEGIVAFIDEYKRQLREISLRTVLKIADLAKSFPDNWQEMAKQTVLKPV
jgi:DNA replication protein DnaC